LKYEGRRFAELMKSEPALWWSAQGSGYKKREAGKLPTLGLEAEILCEVMKQRAMAGQGVAGLDTIVWNTIPCNLGNNDLEEAVST
jgi:hypothetical protein